MAQTTLTQDLNIIANSDLEILPLEGDLAIIQKLDDEPNDVGGLTSAQLKAKFDESGLIIQTYINDSLIPQILENDATECARNAAEAQREEQELERQHAEGLRELAEAQREANEQARAEETTGIVAQAAAQVELARGWADAAQSAAVGGDHALRHAADGGDPITPEMIGAYNKEEIDARLEDLSSGLLPQIIVTADPGSTVTCVMGEITLTAEEVDGTWMFDVPEYGRWDVVINAETVETLLVDTVRQYWSKHRQLIHYTMLYDFGDECEELTGGWTADGYSGGANSAGTWTLYAATKEADHIATVMDAGKNRYVFGLGTDKGILTTSHNAMFALAKNVGTDGGFPDFVCMSDEKSGMMGPSVDYTMMDVGGSGTQWLYTNRLGLNTIDGPSKVWETASNFGEHIIYPAVHSQYQLSRRANWYAVFMTREDDRWTLCSLVEIDAPDSVITLVNDAATLAAILSDKEAVDFMVRECTGDFMAHAIQSATFLTALEASPYKELVYANEHWAKFLAMVA